MNFDNLSVATVLSVDGNSFVNRNGIEVPLREEMQLQIGDVIKSTENSLVVISIPGTQQQIPAYLEVSDGGVASLGFNPDSGLDGQVVVSNIGEGLGNIVFVSEFDGENQAAVMAGQEASEGAMGGLFGTGLLGGSALVPVAGAVGATALLAGLASGDDDSVSVVASSGTPPIDDNESPGGGHSGGGAGGGGGDGGSGGIGAENAGGLPETVNDLINNLADLTEPVPVVGDVVDAVGDVLDTALVGDSGGVFDTLTSVTDGLAQLLAPVPLVGELTGTLESVVNSLISGENGGGLGGVLAGLGQGFESGLAGTPLAVLGAGSEALLGTLGGALGGAGVQVSSFGEGTPVASLTSLLGDLLGTDSGSSGLTDLLGGLGSAISSNQSADSGPLAGIPLLGDLTNNLV